MKEGDKIYVISHNKVETIESFDINSNHHNSYIKTIESPTSRIYEENFLLLEQCADIIANTELQQLVLKYKK